MSKAADNLQRRFGANLSESLGVRTAAPAPADRFPGETAPPAVGPDDGRARARDAGHMELDRIAPDPGQPRKDFPEESIGRLAASLLKHGQLQPLRVRWDARIGKWVVISGERRYRAAVRAGFKTVACIFTDGEPSPEEILEEQLIENLQREDLKPVEAARAYRQLMDGHGWTGRQLSEELHVSPGAISKALSLLGLPDDLQARVDSGEIPATAAYEVAKLEGAEAQRDVAARIVDEGLTRDEATAVVREASARPARTKGRGATRGKPRKVTARTFRHQAGYKVVAECRKGVDPTALAGVLRDLAAQLDSEAAGIAEGQGGPLAA